MSKNTAGPKWTPGPWEFQRLGDRHVRVYAPKFGQIAEFRDYLGAIWEVQAPANARLLTAAPDLYAALEKIVEHFGDPLKVARAALAKARGEAGGIRE